MKRLYKQFSSKSSENKLVSVGNKLLLIGKISLIIFALCILIISIFSIILFVNPLINTSIIIGVVIFIFLISCFMIPLYFIGYLFVCIGQIKDSLDNLIDKQTNTKIERVDNKHCNEL